LIWTKLGRRKGHPPPYRGYSLDLAPSDFYLFRHPKKLLQNDN